jgi:hypothetical protein
MIFTLVLAQIVAAVGYGHFVSQVGSRHCKRCFRGGAAVLENVSIIIVFITNIFRLMGTMFWWRYADQY